MHRWEEIPMRTTVWTLPSNHLQTHAVHSPKHSKLMLSNDSRVFWSIKGIFNMIFALKFKDVFAWLLDLHDEHICLRENHDWGCLVAWLLSYWGSAQVIAKNSFFEKVRQITCAQVYLITPRVKHQRELIILVATFLICPMLRRMHLVLEHRIFTTVRSVPWCTAFLSLCLLH